MSDPRIHRPDHDRLRIDLRAGWELDYWTRKLGVSREELAKAVEIVGDRAQEVADYIAQQGAPATSE
jgi:hypothetical protein